MATTGGSHGGGARDRASGEGGRAARAAEAARRHERLAVEGPPALREFHERMAATQRRAEQMHQTAALMHSATADRLLRWTVRIDEIDAGALSVAAVAEAVNAVSAAVVFFVGDIGGAVAAASDETARTAQDLEFILGEGPAHEVASVGGGVTARTNLQRRWPRYGPAVAELGVHDVVAVPLLTSGWCLGALVAFNPTGGGHDGGGTHYQIVADALVHMLIQSSDPAQAAVGLIGQAGRAVDDPDLVHVAAGMVAVQEGCDVSTALALIKARAFADGAATQVVARQIVHQKLRLESPIL